MRIGNQALLISLNIFVSISLIIVFLATSSKVNFTWPMLFLNTLYYITQVIIFRAYSINVFTPISWLLIWNIVYSCVIPIILKIIGFTYSNDFYQVIGSAMLINSLCFSLIVSGYILACKSHEYKINYLDVMGINPYKSNKILKIISLCMLALLSLMSVINSETSQFQQLYHYVLVPLLCILAYRTKNNRDFIFTVTAIITWFLVMSGTSLKFSKEAIFLSLLLPLLILITKGYMPLKLPRAPIIAVLAFLCLFVFPVVDNIRAEFKKDGSSDLFNIVIETYTNIDSARWIYIVERFAVIEHEAGLIDYSTRGIIDIGEKSWLVVGPFIANIPSIIFPMKPEGVNYALNAGVGLGVFGSSDTAFLAITAPGQVYSVFGLIGIIILMPFLGFLLGYIYNFTAKLTNYYPLFGVFLFSYLIVMLRYESNWNAVLTPYLRIFTIAIMIYIIAYIINKYKR